MTPREEAHQFILLADKHNLRIVHPGTTIPVKYADIVARFRERARLPRRNPGSPRKADRNAAVVQAVRGGLEYRDVAKQFGISHQRVAQIVKASKTPLKAGE